MTFTDHNRIIFLAVMILFCGPVYADDPGITLIYDIEVFPDSILIQWQLFPDSVRFPMNLPLLPKRKPPSERTSVILSDLLTNVDEVNIQELSDLKHHKDHGYVADTMWTVRGSVNHFGHTHYRQNQYRALVSFGIDNET